MDFLSCENFYRFKDNIDIGNFLGLDNHVERIW